MGVPCADDVMLNYQSTSYHDAAGVRQLFGLRPAPEFAAWLEERGIFRGGQLGLEHGAGQRRLLEHIGPVLEAAGSVSRGIILSEAGLKED